MTGRKFTKTETQTILEQLDSGDALTHELAKEYGCAPSDIWALWDERNRRRKDA
ncbi:MAG: hypothetical protein ACRDTJ_16445 [Pseudonocardiaceae bacterium]